ncbi:MAG: VTT domain-containing protein [Candidatus Woesearchaeota archaeon]
MKKQFTQVVGKTKDAVDKTKTAVGTTLGKTIGNTKAVMKKTGQKVRETHSKLMHAFGLGFLVLLLIIFSLGFIFLFHLEFLINIVVSDYGHVGIFFSSLITELLILPLGPDVPLFFGIVIGHLTPWVVLLSVLSASLIAFIIAYYLGKTLGAAGIEKVMGKRQYEKLVHATTKGKIFLLLGAITPIPYIPYLAGVWQLSTKDCFLYVLFPRFLRFFAVYLVTMYLGYPLMQWLFF